MRRKIIAGNWKMNKTLAESEALAREVVEGLAAMAWKERVDVVLCPTYTALSRVAAAVEGSPVRVGAQDAHWEEQGAFTGKVSCDLVRDAGAAFVILGHSEQRTYFRETDATVNRKVKKALQRELIPIVCVGETLEEREGGRMQAVLERQIRDGLEDLTPDQGRSLIIAYEPVWAIGTGRNATAEQAQEAHRFVRTRLAGLFGEETAQGMRIQYGGSLKPDNARELLAQADVDGGLIGGASLKAASFLDIIRAV